VDNLFRPGRKGKGLMPQATELEVIFGAPDSVLMAAADEIATALNATFQKIYKERKLDGRVSLSIARAVTAAMYKTLTMQEQAHSQELARKLIKRLSFLIVPGGAKLQ